MADIMTAEERSRVMAAIKGKDTKPELAVRKYLFSRGLRYRVQVGKLPGRPDIVLPKYRTVVFVDGCFWHGHEGCRYFKMPKSNVEFWEEKISRNVARDARNEAALREQGWRVLRVWECEIKTVAAREERLARLYEEITGTAVSESEDSEFAVPAAAAVTAYEESTQDLGIAAEPEGEYGDSGTE